METRDPAIKLDGSDIQLPAKTPLPLWKVFPKIETAGGIMDRHGGSGPGFDTLRIVLSLVIMGFHGSQILEGRIVADFRKSPFFPLILSLVPLFFCLSGFLVTGSALRTKSVKKFLTNRGLRIFPALTVEVTLSALVLGPLLTQISLATYFSETKFFSYFGNIVGRVRMSLPGVFLDNPVPDTVNASLWTLQPEFYCYLLMALFMLTSVVFKRTLLSAVFLVVVTSFTIANFYMHIGQPTDVFPANVIVFYFFCGVIAYHWRAKIPMHVAFFCGAIPAAYICLNSPFLVYAAALPITYIMIYLGLLKLPLIKPFSNGDYSYGIYLFNYPIQQSIMHLFPGLGSWWLLMLISVPLTLIFSAMSWHCIERPALSLKNRLR